MSAPMKKRLTSKDNKQYLCIKHKGDVYRVPVKELKKYKVAVDSVNAEEVFADVNAKYTKPGALLRGLRVRENLTQVKLAKRIGVTQSDISQMENGTRRMGRDIAQRIAKIFDVNYRSFLE